MQQTGGVITSLTAVQRTSQSGQAAWARTFSFDVCDWYAILYASTALETATGLIAAFSMIQVLA